MLYTSEVQYCQLHKSQVCKGLCVQINCAQSFIYCEKCLEENHGNHLDSCKEIKEINNYLLNSIGKKKNHLYKVKEKYNKLNQLRQYQIDHYDKQIDELRNISRILLNNKCNSLSFQQIKILKDQYDLETQLADENTLNQIEKLIQSLEFKKKDYLINQQQKFTKLMIKYFYNSSSWCIKLLQIIFCMMQISILLLEAFVLAILFVENDDYGQSKERQIAFETIRNQTQTKYFFHANDLYQMGNYEEAINYYNKVINLRKDYDIAYFYKGNALSQLQYYEDAVINYNAALKINSRNDAIYLNKGNALTQLKRFEEAIVCFDKAIKINFNNDQAYYYKGRALHQLEHYFEAAESYDKAININSNNQHYYNSKGIALNYLKEYNKAIKSYESAILISINDEILVNKAISLLSLEKLDDTEELNE